jgi:hypothetical protein
MVVCQIFEAGRRAEDSDCVFTLVGRHFIHELGLYEAKNDSIVGNHNSLARSKTNYFADTLPIWEHSVLLRTLGHFR